MGGIIAFSANDFPLATPIDIPSATIGSIKPIVFRGVRMENRNFGTVFSTTGAFPTNRYMFEVSGATNGTNKLASIFIKDLGCYNLNFATINAGFIKYEVDSISPRQITIEGLYAQYMWRGIHLIGSVWWGTFRDIHFEDLNVAFVGDTDITMEQGTHSNISNPWPKSNTFHNILSVHSGTTAGGGSMKCSLNNIDGQREPFRLLLGKILTVSLLIQFIHLLDRHSQTLCRTLLFSIPVRSQVRIIGLPVFI